MVKELVFSTYVEVILIPSACFAAEIGILHVCGGDPINREIRADVGMYSPRMWRWSSWLKFAKDRKTVFSTYVEVILVI